MTNPNALYSPLDDLRESVQAASELDAVLAVTSPDNLEQNLPLLTAFMERTYERNPCINKYSKVTGHVVPVGMDEMLRLSLSEPPRIGSEDDHTTVYGLIDGLEVRTFTNQKTGYEYHRLTYRVNTGEEVRSDSLGNRITKESMEYVCANNAEIVGMDVYNDAHSLVDLRPVGDIVSEIQAVSSASRLSPLMRMQALGGIANTFFATGTYPELQTQVVSFVNSLSRLEGRCIVASDFIVGEKEGSLLTASNTTTEELAIHQHFLHDKDYERTGPQSIRTGVYYVLYAEALSAQNKIVRVPVSSVLEVA